VQVSPCDCKGSSALRHVGCLRLWHAQLNHPSHPSCSTCLCRYQGVAALALAHDNRCKLMTDAHDEKDAIVVGVRVLPPHPSSRGPPPQYQCCSNSPTVPGSPQPLSARVLPFSVPGISCISNSSHARDSPPSLRDEKPAPVAFEACSPAVPCGSCTPRQHPARLRCLPPLRPLALPPPLLRRPSNAAACRPPRPRFGRVSRASVRQGKKAVDRGCFWSPFLPVGHTARSIDSVRVVVCAQNTHALDESARRRRLAEAQVTTNSPILT
jgi:hypothetical protein